MLHFSPSLQGHSKWSSSSDTEVLRLLATNLAHTHTHTHTKMIAFVYISLSTLVLNSRDRYEKNGNRTLRA